MSLRYDSLTRNMYDIPEGVPETEVQRFINEQRGAINANLAAPTPSSGLASLGGFAQQTVKQIGQAQNASILPDISPGAAWGMTPEQFSMLNSNIMEDNKNRQNREQQAEQQQMQAQQDEARTAIAREGMDIQRQQMDQQQALAIARENQRRLLATAPKVMGTPATGLVSVGRDGNMNPIVQQLTEGTAAPKVQRMQDGTYKQWDPQSNQWMQIAGVGAPITSGGGHGGGSGGGGSKSSASTTPSAINTIRKRLVDKTGKPDMKEFARLSGDIASGALAPKDISAARIAMQSVYDEYAAETERQRAKMLANKKETKVDGAAPQPQGVTRRPDGSVVTTGSKAGGRFEAALAGDKAKENGMPAKLQDGDTAVINGVEMKWDAGVNKWIPVK